MTEQNKGLIIDLAQSQYVIYQSEPPALLWLVLMMAITLVVVLVGQLGVILAVINIILAAWLVLIPLSMTFGMTLTLIYHEGRLAP